MFFDENSKQNERKKNQKYTQVNQRVTSTYILQGYYTKASFYFQESSKQVSI